MKKTNLLLVTKDTRTYKTFRKQLEEYLNKNLNILSPEDDPNYDQLDMILLSSRALLKKHFYPSEKILVARRSINTSSLEQLVSLSPGTKCLVVNNTAESTYETISYLENLGLKLKFYPYYPEMNKKHFKANIAIIPTATELVPKEVKRIIDIGVRPLDFSTLLEIGIKAKLNIDDANLYAAKYIKEIIELTQNLSYTLNNLNKVNQMLDATLNTVHDGIIVTDPKNRIMKMNQSAKKILGLHINDQTFVNKKLIEVSPKLHLKHKHQEHQSSDELVSMNDKKLFVSRTPIQSQTNHIGKVTAFQDVTRIQQLEQNIRIKMQKKGFLAKYTIEDILGTSEKIKEVIRIMHKIGKTEQTVLILGENGTGKELFAHAIHNLSMRKNGPFIPVNFASLPPSLAESELFGYEEGAFTGTIKGGKKGLFEMANNGTIFLDEIGDAPTNLQLLLLRVLQEKQVMRIGGKSIIPVNVRVIAATNQDLKGLIREGKFREDLYYRLFVFPLRIPPLRERKEDIPFLVKHFFETYSPVIPNLSNEVIEIFNHYNWPGNIRELKNVIQYLTVVSENNLVTKEDLPEQFKETYEADSHTNNILKKLERRGHLKDFYYILLSLNTAKKSSRNLGRGKIVHCVNQNKDCSLTEQQVRQRMEILKSLGLIHSGNRGQGSRISEEGVKFLKVYNDRLKQPF